MNQTVTCPDCGSRVRPCNLVRHRVSHLPVEEERDGYVYFRQPKRPIIQYRTKDHRYDEHFPRGEGRYRYRIYRLRGGELQLLAAAERPAWFGVALDDLYQRGEYITDDATGVLDTKPEPMGDWIVHPFALGRRRSE